MFLYVSHNRCVCASTRTGKNPVDGSVFIPVLASTLTLDFF